MKMIGLLLSLILVLMFAFDTTAWAGGPHGGYTNDTASCGQCHNTHAANGTNLIANMAAGSQNSVYRVCVYCHKSGGQSKYDVVNGATNTTKTSNAGGFTNTYLEGVGSTPVVSKHEVDGSEGSSFWAPGYSTVAGDKVELTCASCHDPHSGLDRALRNTILGTAVSPTMSMMISGGDESIRYEDGWNEFCGTCHKDFLQTAAGSGDADSGTYSTKKRHRVDMNPFTGYGAGGTDPYPGVNIADTDLTSDFLSQPSAVLPLEYNGGTPQVSCLTCHFAHSTTKANSINFNRTDGTTASSSTLLRLENRGVCEACHNK